MRYTHLEFRIWGIILSEHLKKNYHIIICELTRLEKWFIDKNAETQTEDHDTLSRKKEIRAEFWIF